MQYWKIKRTKFDDFETNTYYLKQVRRPNLGLVKKEKKCIRDFSADPRVKHKQRKK